MNNVAIVLCGGGGSRFKSRTPKQLQKLAGRELLLYSMAKFESFAHVQGIVLVAHAAYLDDIKELLQASGEFKKLLAVISGGERRQDSALNGLEWINTNRPQTGLVFVHDSARPLFTPALLDALYQKASQKGNAAPAVSITDTVKAYNGDRFTGTMDRSVLKRVQTPQVFEFAELYGAAKELPAHTEASDEAYIMEKTGRDVYFVEGEHTNIKITYPEDLALAGFYLERLGQKEGVF